MIIKEVYKFRRKGIYLFLVFSCSVVFNSVTPWATAHQALSVGFPRQEYWSSLPFPAREDLPDLGIEPDLLHWQWQAESLYRHQRGSR